MGVHRWRDIRARNRTPEQMARLDREVRRALFRMRLLSPFWFVVDRVRAAWLYLTR
jgi:hypothetical protein